MTSECAYCGKQLEESCFVNYISAIQASIDEVPRQASLLVKAVPVPSTVYHKTWSNPLT